MKGFEDMSDQSKFITEAFALIKNSFEEFRNTNITLKIIDSENYPEDFTGARVTCQFDPEELFEILIVNDFEIFKDEESNDYNYLAERNRIFLGSNGIQINEYSLSLGLLLHEFGHIYHQKQWMKFFDIYGYRNLQYITDAYCDTIIRCNDEDLECGPFSLQYIFYEIFAEKFKFEHFMRFWKLLGKATLDEVRSSILMESLIILLDLNKHDRREYLVNEVGFEDKELDRIDQIVYSGIRPKQLIEFL